ncbi:MAG: NAD(P)/FAD-dependent oxidoreductase [Betaproteobacteria bacterium]|nr:NAD(P)/FAD-dependent oxidoreductase [Betaproteobacteria bacterium]MBI2960938.1 NAD(P)/FAD-dependent oxidoreductase [Betaproteobacteria bacterium]
MAYDVLIVGGGHNGLVCAAYLARAGLKVRVLERRDVVGGAATSAEFHPGFRNSVAAYTVSLLHPKVIADLRLARHGLKIVERPLANFLPLSEAGEAPRSFRVGPDLAATQGDLARFSARDAARLPGYTRMIERAADTLRALALETPPLARGGWSDLVEAFNLGCVANRIDLPTRRELLDLFTKSAGDLLDGWFETDAVKAAFGFDSIVGNYASPYTPNTAYVLLHHVFGEVNGKRGAWGHAIGGMGAITQAMAKEALARGVEISTGAHVAEVRVRGARAAGVALADGTYIDARAVAANVNPKMLYLELVAAEHLEPEFRERMARWKCASGTLRMNVALAELPEFACAPGAQAQPHHGAGIIMAPSLRYMEQAYFDARTLGWARAPIVEMLIPSTVDTTLAPRGAHVASLFCQHFAPVLPEGRSWDEAREEAADVVIDTVERYAPNFKAAVLARSTLTPLDLEREFGLTGGDIFHGALSLDQLWAARPMLGYGDYRAPIKGLYLCGSGAHPGGGVTGLPGHNAAREMLRDFRRGRV